MRSRLRICPDKNPRINDAVDRGPAYTWSRRSFLAAKSGAWGDDREYKLVKGWVRGHLGIYRPTWSHPRFHKGTMAGCSWALVHLPTGHELFRGQELVEKCSRTGFAAGGWRWYSLKAWAEFLARYFDDEGELEPWAFRELDRALGMMCNDKASHGQDLTDPMLEEILEDIIDKKPSYAA